MSGPEWTDIVGVAGGIIGTGVGGVSAVIAGRAARRAAKLAEIEADRQHESLKPPQPPEIKAELRDDGTLWGTITVPTRDYQVKAVGIWSAGGEHKVEIYPPLVRANQPNKFPIEEWPPGRTQPKTGSIRFSFWPADEGASSWHCRCGRPETEAEAEAEAEAENKDGHWQWVVPVSYYNVMDSIA